MSGQSSAASAPSSSSTTAVSNNNNNNNNNNSNNVISSSAAALLTPDELHKRRTRRSHERFSSNESDHANKAADANQQQQTSGTTATTSSIAAAPAVATSTTDAPSSSTGLLSTPLLRRSSYDDDDDDDADDADGSPSTPNQQPVDKEFTKLHPLEFTWTFWFDKRALAPGGRRLPGEQQMYETNLREIGSFATVEDFWRYYHHIVKPTEIEINANCHLFKNGIKPMWEDPSNIKGGKWVVIVRGAVLNILWENIILGLIGETLGDSSEICGAVCSRRKKGDKIAVWTRTRNAEAVIMQIGT